jgi:hypothetical protein
LQQRNYVAIGEITTKNKTIIVGGNNQEMFDYKFMMI